MDLKTRIRDMRKAFHLTQEQLATKLGITKQAVSQYERGVRQPDYEVLEALADFFNVDLDYLTGRSDKTTVMPQSGNYGSPRNLILDEETALLENYRQLNDIGREKARDYVTDLAEQEKYTIKDFLLPIAAHDDGATPEETQEDADLL